MASTTPTAEAAIRLDETATATRRLNEAAGAVEAGTDLLDRLQQVSEKVERFRLTIRELADGWTIVTKDHSLSAQWEHTILVTETGCEVLTAEAPKAIEEIEALKRDAGLRRSISRRTR